MKRVLKRADSILALERNIIGTNNESEAPMTRAMLLYLMLKPPPAQRRALRHCVSTYDLDAGYAPDRYHCTLLRLGESQAWSPAMLDELCALLGSVDAEPCSVVFDRLDRNLLRGRNGLTGLRALQRRLAGQVRRLGFNIPDYNFWPHLSPAYGAASETRAVIEPIGWLA